MKQSFNLMQPWLSCCDVYEAQLLETRDVGEEQQLYCRYQ
jgi:hypothetical protein